MEVPPLRRVKKRFADRSEDLECGHRHPGSYREARRRRCHACFVAHARQVVPAPHVVPAASVAPVAKPPTKVTESGEDIDWLAEIEDGGEEPATGPRCTYCLDTTGPFDECSGCRTFTHADCRRELRRCPTIGCRGATAAVPAPMQNRRIVLNIPQQPQALVWRVLAAIGAAILFVLLWSRTTVSTLVLGRQSDQQG